MKLNSWLWLSSSSKYSSANSGYDSSVLVRWNGYGVCSPTASGSHSSNKITTFSEKSRGIKPYILKKSRGIPSNFPKNKEELPYSPKAFYKSGSRRFFKHFISYGANTGIRPDVFSRLYHIYNGINRQDYTHNTHICTNSRHQRQR